MEDNKEALLTDYPNVISYECSKKIITQMERNICKFKQHNFIILLLIINIKLIKK